MGFGLREENELDPRIECGIKNKGLNLISESAMG